MNSSIRQDFSSATHNKLCFLFSQRWPSLAPPYRSASRACNNPENPITDLMFTEIKGHRNELSLYRRKGNSECPHFDWIAVFALEATGNLLET